ncbi:MAG: aspartate 1-decarboxylase [Gemmatimonadota bacterium]|nr:aspartate 1-decarboxylase [Gemmatimonadota bacterium]
MLLQMCKCKIHMATVTETVLNYEGSIGIDRNLLAAADLLPFEKVQVLNVNSGNRLETYVIEAPAGSGAISLNGAAARGTEVGDKVIIIAYCLVGNEEARKIEPKLVFVDGDNRIKNMEEG